MSPPCHLSRSRGRTLSWPRLTRRIALAGGEFPPERSKSGAAPNLDGPARVPRKIGVNIVPGHDRCNRFAISLQPVRRCASPQARGAMPLSHGRRAGFPLPMRGSAGRPRCAPCPRTLLLRADSRPGRMVNHASGGRHAEAAAPYSAPSSSFPSSSFMACISRT